MTKKNFANLSISINRKKEPIRKVNYVSFEKSPTNQIKPVQLDTIFISKQSPKNHISNNKRETQNYDQHQSHQNHNINFNCIPKRPTNPPPNNIRYYDDSIEEYSENDQTDDSYNRILLNDQSVCSDEEQSDPTCWSENSENDSDTYDTDDTDGTDGIIEDDPNSNYFSRF